jgi:ABC-2 type transport system ATP-binding protein
MARRSGAALDRRIDDLVADFDLGAFVDRQVLLLSGGQQRRAHVACALVGEADVLLLDEPTAGADLEAQEQILKRISAEASAGRTILYTSHAMDEITALGARVVIIDRGHVIADSTVPELLAQHTRAAVEVRFAHPIRLEPPNPQTTIDGDVVRVTTDDPARAIGSLLSWSNGSEIVNVEVIRPGLAAAFVALTGRQFEEDQQ